MRVLDGGGLQCPRLSPTKKQLPGCPAHGAVRPPGRAATSPRGPAAIQGRGGNHHQAQRGPRRDTTAGQAPQRTSISAIPGALQVSPGTAQSGPVSGVAAESTPRHEAADFASCAADQPPPLQRGDAADFRRPLLSHYSASSVLTG
ncbi:hypothetical protein NDU88_004486 [Pleurodeles waltl]|uniref:Uncharacterized protein n=1 Tax=Pleurodeles waltl TaxID=8319 RepID=A0AAV7WS10_PLEWA|nr:hypothetical protein NDU88_004486 [Pleurodeles waltl]